MRETDQWKRNGTQHLFETIRNYYPDPKAISLWAGLKEEHYRHLPIYDWVELLKDSVPTSRITSTIRRTTLTVVSSASATRRTKSTCRFFTSPSGTTPFPIA